MKPKVILNAAMTLDGKIATQTGSSEISGQEDILRGHRLRKEMDAIMVGINTVLADDPRLTVHKISSNPEDNPLRVVVDSKARTPPKYRILNPEAPTIIAVSQEASRDKIKALEDDSKAEVIICGDKQVDLNCLMDELGNKGIKTLMLEGGSTLNYSMLSAGLVNEIRVCIAPMIAGGAEAKTLVDGKGVDYMKDAFRLKLKKSYNLGEDLIVEYEVL
ncbi:2,5-diamino-6-(ribosylamino)-4(3H)-pyrimidinone 5'-phosphate reductase [Methanobacterium sp. BAmetb5]|uniref:2,5-diamino-6-(ribosylamino)-4(3H)-pyrimidinone 5'-phosphate reductase n=1 Tax=Methanobacterium sp. BAmetb5 TaxID=2025351 RepID=UPI000E8C4684|nr:2,5-diamino-6-(ribosylamino)-4(3H)-pyrimidinone 5'-phosphate reductase [Methanobacterium sp. BAmetb5]AXV39510.1 MAG: 2,5-diamino-6-(ribosylamino)-4(3H)-pyrimidinone 5'-phosphate reductase [Methanobacterium sp. BAmetb5]